MVIFLLSVIAVLLYLILAVISNNGVREMAGLMVPAINWVILVAAMFGLAWLYMA